MKVDIHCHYVPNKAIQRLEKDPSSYGVRLAEAVAGGKCLCFDYGLRVRPSPCSPTSWTWTGVWTTWTGWA